MLLIIFNITMILVMISSIYWFSTWVIMELTGIAFMMYLCNSRCNSISKKVSSWKYFLYQCLGSIMFLICMFMKLNQMIYMDELMNNTLMLIGLMMKLGLPPFHKWSFEVSENINWYKFYFINSIQKTPSLVMVWKLTDMDWNMMVISTFLLLFSLVGLMDWSLRRFLLYSSVLNYAWVLLCSTMDSMTMLLYLSVYLWSLLAVVMMLSKFSFSCFSFMLNNNSFLSMGPLINFVLSINIMSFSGLPPLAGFVAKYDAILCLIWNYLVFLSLGFMLVSMLMLIIYMLIIVGSSITNKVAMASFSSNEYYTIIICIANMVCPLLYFF